MKNDNQAYQYDKSETDLKSRHYWDLVRKCGQRYKSFDWLSVRLFLNFIYTYDMLSRQFARIHVKNLGLSSASFNILMILSRNKTSGCKQREISKLMLVSRADITGLVDQLAKRGLAERLADQNDRRVWIVKITKKGESLLEAYLPGHYKEIRDLMVSFSRKDKAAFNLFLEKLRSTLK